MEWFTFFGILLLTVLSGLQVHFSCLVSEKRQLSRFAGSALLLAFAVTAAYLSRFSNLTLCAAFLTLYGINRVFLKNSRSSSCVTASVAVCISWFSLGTGNTLEALLLPWITDITPVPALSILCLLISLALLIIFLCWFCFRQITHYFSFIFHQETSYLWLVTPSCLLLLTVELYLSGKAAEECYMLVTQYGVFSSLPYNFHWRQPLAVLILQLLCLGMLFVMLYGCKYTESRLKLHTALTYEIQAQQAYVTQAGIRYEHTRAFRHDVKNHLSVLEGLLKKNDMAGAQSYLKKLEVKTQDLSFPVYTGTPVLDILLEDKLALAQSAGIAVEISLTPPVFEADDLDLCIIFANALDNAITACSKVQGETFIRVAGEWQGDFYLLKFENTCVPQARTHMGIGLSNMKAAAEKYGGTLSLETDGSCFYLSILWQKHL